MRHPFFISFVRSLLIRSVRVPPQSHRRLLRFLSSPSTERLYDTTRQCARFLVAPRRPTNDNGAEFMPVIIYAHLL